MQNKPIRKDDQNTIMQAIGPVIPALGREAVDEGLYRFAESRKKDPEAHAAYFGRTRSGMLNDRVTEAGRELWDEAARDFPELSWAITSNQCGTDFYIGTWCAVRLKRSKRNRGGRTSNVLTKRQLAIKSPVILSVGQYVMDFPSDQIVVEDVDRLWLTIDFDLDELEEALSSVSIGVELKDGFLWKRPLPIADVQGIARLSPRLADRMEELRKRRYA